MWLCIDKQHKGHMEQAMVPLFTKRSEFACEIEREREREMPFIAIRTHGYNVVMQNEQQFVYIASTKLMHVTFSLG